ncbi:MAG: TIGR00282 family metallophosphoesterase [Fimbriimonadales bacterium]
MRILFLGDIVGRPGRTSVAKILPLWRERYAPDLILANAENAAGGNGLTPDIANDLFALGIHGFTMGNHVWDKREIYPMLDNDDRIARPANYSPLAPGKGLIYFEVLDKRLAVISLAGRVFMEHADCPFRTFDALRETIETPFVLVDFHAETTAEKSNFALYVDGRASAVVGTHTHIQTADERILPKGTAYITDVGMCGVFNSSIGMDPAPSLHRFLTGMPARFEVAKGAAVVCAVLIDLERSTGRALSIERLQHRFTE